MHIPVQYAFLFGNLTLSIAWIALYFFRKDLRKEMLVMSCIVGVLSPITGFLWWTIDWWRPLTITGTRVGIEDFFIGFISGGIMAVVYEEVFKKRHYKRRLEHHYPGAFTILLLLGSLTSYFVWILGLTSFYASSVAMIITSLCMFYYRKDLFLNGVLSGLLMAIISLLFYYPIMLFSPEWVGRTYLFDHLSKISVSGIPIEEFAFWFLAGLIFGPFYEYWQGERLRRR